jgi:hypothetical protein
MRTLIICMLTISLSLNVYSQTASGIPDNSKNDWNKVMKEATQINANINVNTYDGFPTFDKNYLKVEFRLPKVYYNNKQKREEYFNNAKDYAPFAQEKGYTEIRIIIRNNDSKLKARERYFYVKDLLAPKN